MEGVVNVSLAIDMIEDKKNIVKIPKHSAEPF